MAATQRKRRLLHAQGQARKRYVLLLVTLFAPVIVLLLIGGLLLRSRVSTTTYHLTMTTGSFSGANYLLAKQYLVPGAQAQHVDLSFIATGGSEDTLNAVQSGRVQVAIVDGGLSPIGRGNVREVAPVFETALHVLMKQSIYDQVVATGDIRAAFRGRTISLSDVGSGTHTFGSIVLTYLGLKPTDYVETPESVAFLTDPKTTAAQIPDIVFAASLLPSPVAERLVHDYNYRLYPLSFVDAYRLQDKAAYGVPIPLGTYGVSPDVPPTDVVTLGRHLLVVANKNVPDTLVPISPV
jgi:TRAP-type uncharacterized transport system substrate-binding protein